MNVMKTIVPLALFFLLSIDPWCEVAFAEGVPTTSFALIVTNNRSTRMSRPDLRYADDDGAK